MTQWLAVILWFQNMIPITALPWGVPEQPFLCVFWKLGLVASWHKIVTFAVCAAAAAAKSLQSCPTLLLDWVAISFSNAWKWKVKVKSLSCVQLLATPWTAAHQAPLSMGFARQEYWSGLPLGTYLGIGSLQMSKLRWGLLRQTLIQNDCVLIKRGN